MAGTRCVEIVLAGGLLLSLVELVCNLFGKLDRPTLLHLLRERRM